MADEIDITQDLVDGSDGSLADTGVVQPNGGAGAEARVPDGTVPADKAPAKTPVTEEFGLRDQLSRAFKGEDPGKDQQQQQAASVALTKDNEGKYRQPDGTFASKEQITAFEAAQTAAPGTDNQQQQQQQQQQQAPTFLQSMTPVEQQQFHALPEEIRQFVGRTMEAVNNQAARFGEYGLIERDLLGPRRQAWAQNGVTPAVALNQLFALSDFATRSPQDFVLWFAEQHKIDLDAALDAREQANSADPQVRALQGQILQMQNQFMQFTTGQQSAQQQATLNEVESFAQEKDGANGLKRPHLTDVINEWPVQIQALRVANPNMPNAEVLQRAYDAACWANPTVRAKMQDAVQKQQREDAKRKADQARLTGSSVHGGPTGTGAATPSADSNLSVRDELKRQFAAAQ
jgi:hypothetical protein